MADDRPSEGLSELDAGALLRAASADLRARRLAEIKELKVLAAWADLHAEDPAEGPGRDWSPKVGNVLKQLGGDGTPGVQDFCLAEIALARESSVQATRNLLADVLDLRYRLPKTWSVIQTACAEPYVARQVARMSRHLDLAVMHVVDNAIARIIGTESPGRVLEAAEAKVIEADPALHAARVEDELHRRYVSLSQTDEAGLRTVIARVEAGEAVWIDATVTRVADILAPNHPGLHRDELRALAFGYLARPAELLALLLEHSTEAGPSDHGEEPHEQTRALAFPADLLDALREADWSALRPKAVLYVHLHEAALRGSNGVTRVEGLCPLALQRLRSLLGRTDLVVKPVLDLSLRIRHAAYEHPESLKERVHLTSGGDYWPYARSMSISSDYDHPTPYRGTGPPGSESLSQTGTHNSGQLTRSHHRWKTHAGYQSRQTGPGRYCWITPHGLAFEVNQHGTRAIPIEHARMMMDAPPGVDIYPSEPRQHDPTQQE